MAYASKYYDPAKAHEYYMKHRQLKGRKKKTSIADLSEEGKIAAKEVKERLNEEMKAELKKVKRGNTAERKRIREKYQKMYEAELEQIRQDTSMVKAPKQKAAKGSKGSKGSKNVKASKGSSGGSKSTSAKQTKAKTQKEKIADAVTKLRDNMPNLTDKQRVEARKIIQKLIKQYQQL